MGVNSLNGTELFPLQGDPAKREEAHPILKIHLYNSYSRSTKLNVFIPESFHNINSGKVLPHKLSQNPIAFAMKNSEIAMLHNQSIINEVSHLVNGLLSS